MTMAKAKAKKKPPLKAHELRERLANKYAAPEWVLLNEVRDSTGFEGNRSADCMAMSTWPSRGCLLYGFEIKVSRADVLKELREPAKAAALSKWCDRWYLVLGRKDLILESELPKTWGLLVPHGSGLKIAKEAPERKPKTWPRTFVASLLRNAWQNTPADAALKKEYERGREQGKLTSSYQAQRDAEDLKKLREKIVKFQEVSGVTTLLDAYSYEGKLRKEAGIVRALMKSGAQTYYDDMTKLVLKMETLSRKVREELVEQGALAEKPSLDDLCPHPQRHGRHEVYVQTDVRGHRKKAGGMKAHCRACGAEGVIGK